MQLLDIVGYLHTFGIEPRPGPNTITRVHYICIIQFFALSTEVCAPGAFSTRRFRQLLAMGIRPFQPAKIST